MLLGGWIAVMVSIALLIAVSYMGVVVYTPNPEDLDYDIAEGWANGYGVFTNSDENTFAGISNGEFWFGGIGFTDGNWEFYWGEPGDSLEISALAIKGNYEVIIRIPLWLILTVVALLGVPFMVLGKRSRHDAGHPKCRRCGYDLTGNASGVCPECGMPMTPGTGTQLVFDDRADDSGSLSVPRHAESGYPSSTEPRMQERWQAH